MEEREIVLRARSFIRFHQQLISLGALSPKHSSLIASGAILPEALSESFSRDEITLLLSDLCAGRWVSHPDSEEGLCEREARLAGAVFHLSTCYPEMIRRMRGPWMSEAGFVRHFSAYFHTSPSDIAGEGDERHPQWSRVRSRLESLLKYEAAEIQERAELLDRAIILEQSVRNHMLARMAIEEVGYRVGKFWEFIREKLLSGFPYYAFRSRFVYWWNQCANVYPWPPMPVFAPEIPDLPAESRPAPEDDALTPQQLRLLREGYRFVRATFFPREYGKADNAQPVDHAHENERYRQALDDIWHNRLQAVAEKLDVEQLIERHSFLNEKTIYVLILRIRERMQAYTLARIGGRTNKRILSMISGGEIPQERRPVLLTIASLARMIPPDWTMLGAFTAHLFLYPKVSPQRPAPLPFHRYLSELWWWINDETFDEAIEWGSAAGSPSHECVCVGPRF
jgi:hypothetical protein